MAYTTFSKIANNALKEPMFFGNPVNVARYDQQRFEVFEKLIEKQLSFFWRPEEIDVSRDRIDFSNLPDHEQHIFISNLKYQTLLDSIQGRSPNIALLPIVSLPELETWIETWSFSETIHSRSYTHILRNLFTDPSEVFEDIVTNEEIQKRASDIAGYYDQLIHATQFSQLHGLEQTEIDYINLHGSKEKLTLRSLKKKLYLCICSINALEAIRFYVSFACSFAFAERGKDDPEMAEVAIECFGEGREIFLQAAEQEKEWAKYLFKDGSMIGLNEQILCQYVEYISNQRMQAIGYEAPFAVKSNPIPWINHWLVSDNVQVAPQEAEISSYLVGQINSKVDSDDLSSFEL